jgi:hypothetical protein
MMMTEEGLTMMTTMDRLFKQMQRYSMYNQWTCRGWLH